MENRELKPCPFCGGHNLEIISCDEDACCDFHCDGCDDKRYTVCCSATQGGCGCASGYKDTKEEAIEAWNRRAENGT